MQATNRAKLYHQQLTCRRIGVALPCISWARNSLRVPSSTAGLARLNQGKHAGLVSSISARPQELHSSCSPASRGRNVGCQAVPVPERITKMKEGMRKVIYECGRTEVLPPTGKEYLMKRLGYEVGLVSAAVLVAWLMLMRFVDNFEKEMEQSGADKKEVQEDLVDELKIQWTESEEKDVSISEEGEKEEGAEGEEKIDSTQTLLSDDESDYEAEDRAAAIQKEEVVEEEEKEEEAQWSPFTVLLTHLGSLLREGPTKMIFLSALLVRSLYKTANILISWIKYYPQETDYSMLYSACEFIQPLDNAAGQFLLACFYIYSCLAFVALKYDLVKRINKIDSMSDAYQEDAQKLIRFMSKVASLLAYGITAISVAGLAGLDLKPLLAIGGAGSVVIGLASQGLLANFAAGLSFLWERPFVPGEQVTLSCGIRGKVKSISLVRTEIVTDDGELVCIPNKILGEMIITNRSYTFEGLAEGAGPLLPSPEYLRFNVSLPSSFTIEQLTMLEKEIEVVIANSGLPGAELPEVVEEEEEEEEEEESNEARKKKKSATIDEAEHEPRFALRIIRFGQSHLTALACYELDEKKSSKATSTQVQNALALVSLKLKEHEGALLSPPTA